MYPSCCHVPAGLREYVRVRTVFRDLEKSILHFWHSLRNIRTYERAKRICREYLRSSHTSKFIMYADRVRADRPDQTAGGLTLADRPADPPTDAGGA